MTSQTYTVTPAEMDQFRADVYADPDCHIIPGSGGAESSGELIDHSPVGTITLSYTYTPNSLVVTLVSKPWEVPSGSVFNKITSMIQSVSAPKEG